MGLKLNRTPPLSTLIDKVKSLGSVGDGVSFYNQTRPGICENDKDLKSCSGTAVVFSMFLTGSGELSLLAAQNKKGDGMELTKSSSEIAAQMLTSTKEFVGYGVSNGKIGHDWVVAKAEGRYAFFQANADSSSYYAFPKLNPANKDYNRYMTTEQDFTTLIRQLTDSTRVTTLMPMAVDSWRLILATS